MDNRPIAARHFEMAVIDPRTFSRFVGPMCAWFYAWTGDERYLDLLRAGSEWLKSAETPKGWAYSYLPDGTPVFCEGFQVFRYDRPDTWPLKDGSRWSREESHEKVNLTGVDEVLRVINDGGRKGIREWLDGPETLGVEEYQSQRKQAAMRLISSSSNSVGLSKTGERPRVMKRTSVLC